MPSLLSFTSVSLYCKDLVLHTLRCRLRRVLSYKDLKLHLTWFAPSAGSRKAPFTLEYIGTDYISADQGATNLYSRFRLGEHAEQPYFSGRALWWMEGIDRSRANKKADFDKEKLGTEHISLDWYENFSQFCVKLELAKLPLDDQCSTKVSVIEDQTIRISRSWLNTRHSMETRLKNEPTQIRVDKIFWLDTQRTIGLRISVHRKPTPTGNDSEASESVGTDLYDVILEGELSLCCKVVRD